MLEPVEKAFHPVALGIDDFVVSELLLAVGSGRNHRIDAFHSQLVADRVGVIAFVECGGLDHVVRIEVCEQFAEPAAVRALAGTQDQCDALPFNEESFCRACSKRPSRALCMPRGSSSVRRSATIVRDTA